MKEANAMLSEFLSGQMSQPVLSMRGLLLLEKAGSPFVSQGQIIINDDGTMRTDANGKPVRLVAEPTLGDIATAFYILTNQEHPRILEIIRNPDMLEMSVMQFAADLSPQDLSRVAQVVSGQMSAMNAFAAKLPGGDEKKAQIGDTDTPPASSSFAAAASGTCADGSTHQR